MFSEMGFQHSARALLLTTAGIVCGGLLVAGCSQSQDEKDEKILVFAANSLIEALAEVEALFEDETGNVVTVSYGASQALAQQIAQGAPADVYISAGQEPMRYLRERAGDGEAGPPGQQAGDGGPARQPAGDRVARATDVRRG